jgi:hypothetical protein
MLRSKLTSLFAIHLLICLLVASETNFLSAIPTQADLKYQDRGDRYEGVLGSKVSDRVELISAMVDFHDAGYVNTPEQFKLKLYLPNKTNVSVTVREINTRTNYWMDRIRPSGGWHAGFGNEFAWPTADVIQRLDNLNLSDLGAIAQLGSGERSNDITVAPVILFYTKAPRKVTDYSFAFRISRKADVTCLIFKDGSDDPPVLKKVFPKMLGNLPRSIVWNASSATEGSYRLVIEVVYTNDGEDIKQVVHFFHHTATS